MLSAAARRHAAADQPQPALRRLLLSRHLPQARRGGARRGGAAPEPDCWTRGCATLPLHRAAFIEASDFDRARRP